MGRVIPQQLMWVGLLAIGLGGCEFFPSVPQPQPSLSSPSHPNRAGSEPSPTIASSQATLPDVGSDFQSRTKAEQPLYGVEAVDFQSIGELTISQGPTEALRIEAPEAILSKLTSEVSGGQLILGIKPNQVIDSPSQIRYFLTLKTLKGLRLSGAGNVMVDRLKTPSLAVTLNGTGNVQVSGTAERQLVQILGASHYQADQLHTQEAVVSIQGTGAASVYVTERLDADISGAGSVEYLGQPMIVNQTVNGAGTVQSR